MVPCITCEAEPHHAEDCSVAWGQCGHSYHVRRTNTRLSACSAARCSPDRTLMLSSPLDLAPPRSLFILLLLVSLKSHSSLVPDCACVLDVSSTASLAGSKRAPHARWMTRSGQWRGKAHMGEYTNRQNRARLAALVERSSMWLVADALALFFQGLRAILSESECSAHLQRMREAYTQNEQQNITISCAHAPHLHLACKCRSTSRARSRALQAREATLFVLYFCRHLFYT